MHGRVAGGAGSYRGSAMQVGEARSRVVSPPNCPRWCRMSSPGSCCRRCCYCCSGSCDRTALRAALAGSSVGQGRWRRRRLVRRRWLMVRRRRDLDLEGRKLPISQMKVWSWFWMVTVRPSSAGLVRPRGFGGRLRGCSARRWAMLLVAATLVLGGAWVAEAVGRQESAACVRRRCPSAVSRCRLSVLDAAGQVGQAASVVPFCLEGGSTCL